MADNANRRRYYHQTRWRKFKTADWLNAIRQSPVHRPVAGLHGHCARVSSGGTGVGIVEVYDLDATSGYLLGGIAPGFVQTGDNADDPWEDCIVVTQATKSNHSSDRPIAEPVRRAGVLANPQMELHDVTTNASLPGMTTAGD